MRRASRRSLPRTCGRRSRPSCHDFLGRAGGQRAHVGRAGASQYFRAFLEGRASRAYIIHENDACALDSRARKARAACPRQRERAAHVRVASRGVQRHLRRRCTHTPKRVAHREIETLRKISRLVESTSQPPPWMKRHRHDEIAFCQDLTCSVLHQSGKRVGERSPSFVLERVNDVAKHAFVASGGGSNSDVRARPSRERSGDEASEADGTDAPVRGCVERGAACGACGRQRRGKQGVYARSSASENSCRSALPQRRSSS